MPAMPWSPWVARLRAAGSIRDTGADRHLHYEPAFEGLRSALLLLVVASHTQAYLLGAGDRVLVKGFGLMPMFFVLSGFLVGSIVLTSWERSGSIRYGPYLKRRIMRLGAPILLYVVVHLVVSALRGIPMATHGRTLGEVGSDLTVLSFTSNLVPSFGYNVPFDAGQMWSLGVDMQLYLVLPFVVLLFLTRLDRPVHIVVAGVIVAAAIHVIRFAEFHHFYGGPAAMGTWEGITAVDSVYQRPENSLDAFVIGFVILVLWRKRMLPTDLIRRLWIPATGVFILIVLTVPLKGRFAYQVGYPIVLICSCIGLAESLRPGSPMARFLGAYPLRLLGRVSFTLYVWHLFVFTLVNAWLPTSAGNVERIAVGAVTLAVVSVVAWWIAERPLLRLPPVGHPAFLDRRRRRVARSEGSPSGPAEALGPEEGPA